VFASSIEQMTSELEAGAQGLCSEHEQGWTAKRQRFVSEGHQVNDWRNN
jgi:hypothetical protein